MSIAYGTTSDRTAVHDATSQFMQTIHPLTPVPPANERAQAAGDAVAALAHRWGGIASELSFIWRQAARVWRLIPLRHRIGLLGAALLVLLGSACSTGIPLLLGWLVDAVQRVPGDHRNSSPFAGGPALYLVLIGAAVVLRESLNVTRRYLVEDSCTRLHRKLTVRLVNHLLRVDLGLLAHDKVGALDNRISRSVEGVVRFLRLCFLDFAPAILTGALALAATLWKQPLLGVVMAGVMPLSIVLTVRQLASQKDVRCRLMRLYEEIDGMVVEQLGGIEYIRAAHAEALETRRLARMAEQRRALEIRHHVTMSLFGCAKALNEGLFYVLLLAGGVYFATAHDISFGDVLTLSMLFLGVMAPLSEVHRVIDEGHESSLRVRDLLGMLDEPLDRSYRVSQPCQPRLEAGKHAIVVRNLRADYVSRDRPPVRALDGVSFEIRHGETIGIAGASGSGKSTCVKVLLKLVHPSHGDVFVGGVRLADISRADIARFIGYVGQEPFVFAGTINENIAYGPTSPSFEQVSHVAAVAHLHDEIMQMPAGYEAAVAERGHNLSGGQCQRLALARTLLRQAPILIFDEATSALDNIGERHIQRALEQKGDRTLIIVAHRVWTLRRADRILVFDKGRIIETGTYEDLVRAGGAFANLVASARE